MIVSASHSPGQTPPNRGEVHLWYDILDADHDATLRAGARDLLTVEEWERCQRFVFADGQRECLGARRLVRSVLSFYVEEVRPSDWRFTANEYGRPEIEEPAAARGLRFNLSHANGVVACVVSAHYEVGVDVEHLARRTPLQLADSRFAPSEVAALRALPEAHQPRRFLEYWTLKEAYIKARGAGLSLPLDQFSFDLTRPGRPAITFEPGFGDVAEDWQFDRLKVGTDHLLAVATRKGADPRVDLIVRAFATP